MISAVGLLTGMKKTSQDILKMIPVLLRTEIFYKGDDTSKF
jgi:hypothetical protein